MPEMYDPQTNTRTVRARSAEARWLDVLPERNEGEGVTDYLNRPEVRAAQALGGVSAAFQRALRDRLGLGGARFPTVSAARLAALGRWRGRPWWVPGMTAREFQASQREGTAKGAGATGYARLPAGPSGEQATTEGGAAAAGVPAESLAPPMPPWLRALTYGYQQRYPGANLPGLPPVPSAQYMRNLSPSALEGLIGTIKAAGGYVPDWLALVEYLAPRGGEFRMPVRNVFS